jgi:transposase
VPQEVTGSEPPDQKDILIQQLRQENKLLKEKLDLLIRRLFGSKSEQLDAAQLELLLKEADLGKAAASAEKAEAAPITGLLKPVPKPERKNERRERWPEDLPVECEIIEPQEVIAQPEAFGCVATL